MDGAEARTRMVPDLSGGRVLVSGDGSSELLPAGYRGQAKLDHFGHLWVVLVGYVVDPRELPNPMKLGPDNVLHTARPACYLCEKTYEEANHKPCTGDPVDQAAALRWLGLE